MNRVFLVFLAISALMNIKLSLGVNPQAAGSELAGTSSSRQSITAAQSNPAVQSNGFFMIQGSPDRATRG